MPNQTAKDMIYCVEDDQSIRDLLVYTLQATGFAAQGFANGSELWAALSQSTASPQLILLDIMLPDEDGLLILQKLRNNPASKNIPVILATAKGTEYDKISGLDAGADDYLAKPFSMLEMTARIRAVLRRCGAGRQTADALQVDELILDQKSHAVTLAGQPLTLTLKEFQMLLLFMQHPGQVFSREMLLQSIWGLNYTGETRTVDVHIGTLRTKLGQAADLIETVRGVGYRLRQEELQ